MDVPILAVGVVFAAVVVAVLLLRQLAHLQAELARMGRAQEELRRDVHHGREASMRELAQATQGLRGEIGQAQRALVEVKALEQGRARQMEQAADSLRRLEAVLAGSATRGSAGENIVARALAQLPPDLLAVKVAFGSRVVEYALRLPGGRLLPIDSKWTSAASLERLSEADDVHERRRLADQVGRDLRVRVREMTKYLDPERTMSLALLAVPDAVYLAAPEVHADGHREGVLVVPYSWALPCVLALYRLIARFGAATDAEQIAARLHALDGMLARMDDEIEGRLSRGLVQVQNARDALRDELAAARRGTGRLLEATGAEAPFDVPLKTT